MTQNTIRVGMDAHKNSIAVAALFPDRLESVEWTEATTPEAIRRLARKLRREAPEYQRDSSSKRPAFSVAPFRIK